MRESDYQEAQRQIRVLERRVERLQNGIRARDAVRLERKYTPKPKVYLRKRTAVCKFCGFIDLYPMKRELRLRHQKCFRCDKLLGDGAHARWRRMEAQAAKDALVGGHTQQLAVAFTRPRRSVDPETPVIGLAPAVVAHSVAGAPRCCAHQRDPKAVWHCLKKGCCVGHARCNP